MKGVFIFAALVAVAVCELRTLRVTEGESAIINVGDDNAKYCQLRDGANFVVFEDFGPCRYTVDHVGQHHAGIWEASLVEEDKMVAEPKEINIETVHRPIVTTSVEVLNNETKEVFLHCHVKSSLDFSRAKFRSPQNNIIILGSGGEDGVYSDESAGKNNNMTTFTLRIDISEHHDDVVGTWRCATETDSNEQTETYFAFMNVPPINNDTDVPQFAAPILKSQSDHVNASSGASFTLMCHIDSSLDFCYFRSDRNRRVYAVAPGISNSEFEYVGSGLEAGECGIRIMSAEAEHSGLWSCNIGPTTAVRQSTRNLLVFVQGLFVDVMRIPANNNRVRMSLLAHMNVQESGVLEYCRFIRSDGLRLSNSMWEEGHEVEMSENWCSLNTPFPTSIDFESWFVAAKLVGDRQEYTYITLPLVEDAPPPVRPPSNGNNSGGGSFFFVWRTFFGFLILGFLLVLMGLMVQDYRRKWATRKSAAVRRNFQNTAQQVHNSTITGNTVVMPEPRLVDEKPPMV